MWIVNKPLIDKLKDPRSLGYLNKPKSSFVGISYSRGKEKTWYLDSGCSRHMTDDEEAFFTLRMKEERMVTFGDDGKVTL